MTELMELTRAHVERIRESLPVERGNVSMHVLSFLNAVLYVAENGCKWRRLPTSFGNWHTIYTRMNRWSKAGVWDRVFARLQQEGLLQVELRVVALDSTIVKVHPDGTGALKKTVRRPSVSRAAAGPPRFIWLPRMSDRPWALPSRPANAATGRKAES
jgi:transposase